MIATLMQQIGNHQNLKIEEDLVRHMALNTLRAHRARFKEKYGELVICCDNRHYWRKEIFPYYKANRKKDREKSESDWPGIFKALDKIRLELIETFPYSVVTVSGAEADDIIATLVQEYAGTEKIMIVSSDKDFSQLQKFANVQQYSPLLKKEIVCYDPKRYLKEHIIRGDKGDGIPNIFDADNSLILNIRAKKILTKKLDEWVTQKPEEFCSDNMLRNYYRNEQLIDLSFIPEQIKTSILDHYNQPRNNRSKIFNYFIEHKLRNLIDAVGDF